jgi:uncharacterized tellurite resistance protein B-like protein
MGILDLITGRARHGSIRMGEVEHGSPETDTLRKIVHELNDLEPKRARHIACFAYLLSRVANADLDISDQETEAMERIVVERGQLPEAHAVIVVQMARSRAQMFGETDDFLVAREFNEVASREEKLALVDCLFAVSASDGGISSIEDAEIGKIANELVLSREDVASLRGAYKDYLNVLKKPEDQ